MLESRLQNSRPPLLVGERAVWLGSGSGLPQGGVVRWMGKLQGMGPGWTVGLELDRALPYGGIDGSWCGRQLFKCQTKHGLLVPATVVVKEDALLRTFGVTPVIPSKPPLQLPEPRAPSQQSISESSISTSGQKPITKPKRTKHAAADSSSRPSSQQSVTKRKPNPQPPTQSSEEAGKQVERPPPVTASQPNSEIQQTETSLVVENSVENKSEQSSVNPTPAETVSVQASVESPQQQPVVQRRGAKGLLAKAGYFHTAPARPNRHLRGSKPPAPAPPTPAATQSCEQQPPQSLPGDSPSQSSSLPHLTNKENNEYAWSPLVPKERSTPPRVPLRRHNSLNGPRSCESLTPDAATPTTEELIYQWFDASDSPPTAPPRHARPKPPMNNSENKSPSLSPSSSSSSFEDAIAAADAIYSERFKKHFSVDSASSISSTSSSANRKSGGFLSFLRWLRRGGSESSEEKVNELSRAGSTNSLGTVVSAASSFAYIGPNAYHVPDNRASLHYAPNLTDSETYKHRIKQRDHARRLDKNLTLKRKYKLKQFACSQETVFSETLKATPKPSTGSSGRRRKRPAPPIPTKKSEHYSDYSLPASLEQRARLMDMEELDKPGAVKLHRRTASESSKDKRAGAYCHVRGKRRAPQPPANQIIRPNSALATKFKNPFPSFGRKKRQAPPPPNEDLSETSTKLSNAEKQRLIANISKLKMQPNGKGDKISMNGLQGPALITAPPIVLNAIQIQEGEPPQVKLEPSVNKASMSPKPWYKRNSSKVTKVEKRTKKEEEEMPEVNYARKLPSPVIEDKRKSMQLSMLASISELDREAAEILQNQRTRAAELIAARNNSFYLPPDQPAIESPSSSTTITPSATTPESPTPPATPDSPTPKVHTKGLISMFNAITNVSKVTVNTSTAAIAGFFNGDARKHRISQTFATVEEQEEEESSTNVDVKVTKVQSSSQNVTTTTKVVETSREDVRVNNSQAIVVNNKKSSPRVSPESDAASSSNNDNIKVNSSQMITEETTVVNGKTIKASLYPRLSAFEPKENSDATKETPLPLSIAGIPDSVSPTRQRRIVWSCPRCTLENPRWRLTCDVCDMWRPSSVHEETVLPIMSNLHAVPAEIPQEKTPETNVKVDDGDDFKRPEPIGAIDWESELKRYFGPNDKKITDVSEAKITTKVEEKKPEAAKKVSPLLNSKVVDAIKILEGKQTPVETAKPGQSKTNNIKSPNSPNLKINPNKEPEYAAVALNKKTNASAAKLTETKNIVNNPPQPFKTVSELKTEDKIEIKVSPINSTEQKTPQKLAESTKVPDTFIGGRTKADNQKITKSTSTETKPPEVKTLSEIPTKLLSKEDVDEVRKARLAFFNKPPEIESPTPACTDAKPPASPRVNRAKTSVGVPEAPGSPRITAVKTTVGAIDIKETKSSDLDVKGAKTPAGAADAKVAKTSAGATDAKVAKTPAGATDAKVAKTPAGVPDVKCNRTSVISPEVPSSPRLTRTKTVETATDTQELLTKMTMTAIATSAITSIDKDERMRLREKLKEMKNSLPKHARPDDNHIPTPTKAGNEVKNESSKLAQIETSVSQGAIKKIIRPVATVEASTSSSKKGEPPYENLKNRRVLNRAVKVSTSVQTSGAIVARKPKAEDPVEATPGNIKGGKIYTSLHKSPSFRGTGTFQLIGAKDFATIEATKSTVSTEVPPLQHVYANVPSPGLVQDGPSEQTKNVPVPHVATPVQSPPTAVVKPEVQQVAPAAAPVVPPPNQVVVKVETKPQVLQQEEDEEEDEEMVGDDHSSASGGISFSGDSSDVEKLAGMLTGPKGLAEFKADLAASPPQQKSNTLAVNRLLRSLEAAIANGQHRIAAGLARDLARLKVSCSVIRQRKATIEQELFTVDMYVEDKVSHQGPIPLSVSANMTVGELKVKVQQEFEIPAAVQRWILGKQLASDDTKSLQQHSVAAAGCTVFLYLVAPPERTESSSPATEPSAPAPTPPPVDETRMVPTVEPPRGPGWYYNFEEDRYSYCESSDESEASDPEDEPAPAKLAPTAVSTHPPPPTTAPAITLAEPDESESSSEEEEEEDVGAGGLLPTAPPATLTPEQRTGTLMLGWKCPLCTLINSPTRPGCAACTTERPANYRVPTNYAASEAEALRLQREEETEKAAQAEEEGARAGTAQQDVDNYQALLALDNTDLVFNVEMFECPVCLAVCAPGDGAMLRECLHAFCRACLAHTAQFSEEVEVHCPFRNQQYACDATMQEREVRALVPPEVYERMQAKSVAQAENKIQNAFHCKTPDCRGWCIFEDNVNDFACPVCGHHNCLTCQAIHDGLNCRQYQERVTQASETDAEARRTKEMLEEMVARGEALCCPTCQVVLMKKWGCDWLRCSMCKTEICWVTRGPRWGPGGKGDTTGGCKCGINGIKCHPKCNYCH